MNKSSLLCCDWGTSNFRLYLVNISNGKRIGMIKSHQGIANTFNAWKQRPSDSRVHFFRHFLQTQVQRLAITVKKDLTNIPIILSGMASSSIGMEEVTYTKVPFDIDQPILAVKHFSSHLPFSNDLFLFGGLRTEKDVMRGEEVQLLGISHLIKAANCICLLPGTHSKHIWINNQKIVDFQTFMTGECFELLCHHSIIKNTVESTNSLEEKQRTMFQQGVFKAISGNLLNDLFSIRTNVLLQNISTTDNYYYLSGLLIGHELKALKDFQGQLLLGGDQYLVSLYQLALATLELDAQLTVIKATDMEHCIPMAHLKLFQQL